MADDIPVPEQQPTTEMLPIEGEPQQPLTQSELSPDMAQLDGVLTDDELASLLCDENGEMLTPDGLESKMSSVLKAINRLVGKITKWISKQCASVDEIIQGIVAAIMGQIAPLGAEVSQLLSSLESRIMQWIANQMAFVQESTGGLARPPFPTSGGIGSTSSSVQSGGLGIGGNQQTSISESGAIPQFPLGTPGAGFGGESAVGFASPASGTEARQMLASVDPCDSLSDEERAVWGCKTKEDVVFLRTLGDFQPMLPPGVKLKQWLEDNFPVLRDSRNTPEQVF